MKDRLGKRRKIGITWNEESICGEESCLRLQKMCIFAVEKEMVMARIDKMNVL